MDRSVITRHLELARGGKAGNQAAPIITMEMMNGSGGVVNRGDVVVLQKTAAVAGTRQVETATVVGTITTAGNATVIVTAADMTGSPVTFNVAVLVGDTASVVAGKIRNAINGNYSLVEMFTVSGSGANVVMTSKHLSANDSTLNISVDNGTCAGLTQDLTSTNTTAGVAASGSTADLLAFTTTTSGDNRDAIGIVYDARLFAGTLGRVQVWGPTDALKVDGTTDITYGDYLSTFTTAKIAQKTTGAGAFAIALEGYTTNDSSGVLNAFITTMGDVPRPAS